MPAVAITDHGTMFGVIEFFNTAKAAGVKPVIGLEAYLAPRGMADRDPRQDKHASHLLLLAENMTGYRNLLEIASVSQLEGFYYHPRVDRDFLASHAEGLIATSGCMAAEIPRAIQDNNLEAARKKLEWYYDVFGKDRFFLELQEHDIKELPAINKALVEMGPRYQARYIATNDVHYVDPDDYRYQDVLLAIQTGAVLTDASRFRMTDPSYYLRPPEEMARLFSNVPGALSNTLEIAERCNVDLSSKGYHLPLFDVPEGHTSETYLRTLCEEGLRRRYQARANDAVVRERLEYELSVIHKMGFDAYFLIVWDLCRHAREVGIWYNARGSAAGSLVAHTLDITLVEPIEHRLIFERFLNPGRISMPDIDLDFQDDMRPKMLEYCAQRYGNDKVAQIITFGTLGARAAIRDVGRVMDIPLSEVDRVSKLIPNIPSKPTSIDEALEQVPELKTLVEQNSYMNDLVETARHMEGVVRNAGTHAAGVIITDKPIVEYVPLHRPTSGSEESPIKSVSQFEMAFVDSLGLLKVDFLGLATLTVMERACELIEKRHGKRFSLQNIPIDDAETFDFLGAGHTAGVFQLEGNGMTRYLVQMKPKNLANIIAMVALYRPGPLEFIPSYIKRMHNEEPVTYRHPALESIFQETYGIPIYQEQIMFAAMELAGYTASDADDLRKAISKKKAEAILKHREKFIQGSTGRGVDKETATAIFDDWENFARYGFNKSHAADYGVIAVQTAYLKTHYTVEYMTALLSASKNETDKITFYVGDCRSMGVQVLPPDINHSNWDFSVEDLPDGKAAIRFGLGAVKNVGQAPVELMLKAREEGAFKDLNDFARRVDLRSVGRRSLECLIKVGALDSFGSRCALLEGLDMIMGVSSSHFRAVESGQMSFFGLIAGVEEDVILPICPPPDVREQLRWERELIGLYISDHPLSPYLPVIKSKITHFSNQLSDLQNKEKTTVGGMVTNFRTHTTKNGKMMAFVTLEDPQGLVELVMFPRTYEQYHTLLGMDAVVIATGRVDTENIDPKVLVDTLSEVKQHDLPDDMADFVDNFNPDIEWMLQAEDRESELEAAGQRGDARPSAKREVTSPAEIPGWDDEMPPPPEPPDWFPPDLPPEPGRTGPAGRTQQPAKNAVIREKPEPQMKTSGTNESTAKPSEDLPTLSPVSYILPPGSSAGREEIEQQEPRMLTLILRSSGDKQRDNRRMRRLHGLLCSCPGRDHFAFMIFERGHYFLIEFPNYTTGLSSDLLRKVGEMIGEENLRVEPIHIQ